MLALAVQESDVKEYNVTNLLECMKKCRDKENKKYCKALSFVYGEHPTLIAEALLSGPRLITPMG